MACMCVEIETTRDIARQILRHRSFHFQEFSQRYSEVDAEPVWREARLQDKKNRQNSIQLDDDALEHIYWEREQAIVFAQAMTSYKRALKRGIAKEVARALLPEGLTQTRMYMQGTVRDWLNYVSIRTGTETQLEHRLIAMSISKILEEHCPGVYLGAIKAGVIPWSVN